MKLVMLLNALSYFYYKSALKKLIDKALSAIFLAPVDLIFTSGRALTDKLVALGVRKEKIVPVYPALRDEFIRTRVFRDRIKSDEDTINLLFVGRMAPVKGLGFLIEALNQLNGEKIKLLMVVHPSPYPPYEKEILNSIHKYGLARTKSGKEVRLT